ncbi:MAG: lipid-binding SYLF domain-containing protein [Bdellovibrionaceae bacterium]|nr:lipid-binding SYLF domain-containing protein [Pseudobdellovibrionaceae bacterium]
MLRSLFLFTALTMTAGFSSAMPNEDEAKFLRRDATPEQTTAYAKEKSIEATNAFEDFIRLEEESIPNSMLKNAKCVAVIPDLWKAGLIVGAQAGTGLVSCRTDAGWSQPAFFDVGGLSIGLQAGIQKVDLVMVFTHRDAVKKLTKPQFTLGGEASASIGPVGRYLEAGTDYKLDSEVYTYSKAKGFYLGLNLQGMKVLANKKINGNVHSTRTVSEILSNAGVSSMSELDGFVSTLNKYAEK